MESENILNEIRYLCRELDIIEEQMLKIRINIGDTACQLAEYQQVYRRSLQKLSSLIQKGKYNQ